MMGISRHVIDTNVLLVASAADEASPFPDDVTPVEEEEFRKIVLQWLIEFDSSDRHAVLDWDWTIVEEYRGENRRTKLTEQDYGMQVILKKFSEGEVFGFTLEWDEPDSAKIDDENLSPVIHDHADRKMVAAVIAGGRRSGGCNLVNACDTDWYDWETDLEKADIEVHQVIGEEWCRPRWESKSRR